MKDLLKKLLTESDNVTPDLMRYMALGSVLVSWGMTGYSIYSGHEFHIQDFGVGQGALFAGVGVALGLKKESGG